MFPRRLPKDTIVYQCPECESRYLGEQRGDDCGIFCRRLGPGGPCPSCDEPVAVVDILPVIPAPNLRPKVDAISSVDEVEVASD